MIGSIGKFDDGEAEKIIPFERGLNPGVSLRQTS